MNYKVYVYWKGIILFYNEDCAQDSSWDLTALLTLISCKLCSCAAEHEAK